MNNVCVSLLHLVADIIFIYLVYCFIIEIGAHYVTHKEKPKLYSVIWEHWLYNLLKNEDFVHMLMLL